MRKRQKEKTRIRVGERKRKMVEKEARNQWEMEKKEPKEKCGCICVGSACGAILKKHPTSQPHQQLHALEAAASLQLHMNPFAFLPALLPETKIFMTYSRNSFRIC